MIERDFKVYFPEIDNPDIENDKHCEKFAYDNYKIGDYEFWEMGSFYRVVAEHNGWCSSEYGGRKIYYETSHNYVKPVKDTKVARIFHKNNIIEGNGKWLIIKI